MSPFSLLRSIFSLDDGTQAGIPEGSLSLYNKARNECHSFEHYKSINFTNMNVKVIFLLKNVLATCMSLISLA